MNILNGTIVFVTALETLLLPIHLLKLNHNKTVKISNHSYTNDINFTNSKL